MAKLFVLIITELTIAQTIYHSSRTSGFSRQIVALYRYNFDRYMSKNIKGVSVAKLILKIPRAINYNRDSAICIRVLV